MLGQPAETSARIINYLSPDASGPSKSGGGFVKVDSFILSERQSGCLRGVPLISGKFEGGRAISDAMFCHEGVASGKFVE
ncbi:hypothetical protein CEXT_562971 [Caerostris extrusa]|uniref:Uncharacterized protein n=1 Tax=Caerostris extrusa TaxID=172846 RepID=A0AAV4WRZ2_CAEEX|nr:hypothetical protein CEXT_562971 [Caerostris extrusa]